MTYFHLILRFYRLCRAIFVFRIAPRLTRRQHMLLKDRIAVITGGAGPNGLGFATARMMAAQGATVVILDLAQADPAGAAARLGPQHMGLVADVTDKASCQAAVDQVVAKLGRVDVLFNNAGITQPRKTLDISAA